MPEPMNRCEACGSVPVRPVLRPDVKSIQDFLTWVADHLADGKLAPGTAKELNNSASKMTTALTVEENLREMDELRELVRRAEGAADRRSKNEVADRYDQGDSTKGSFELVR